MRSSSMFRSLRHRNAQLFFGGLMVSNIGTWMQMTAMSLVVYELTGKATDTGITLLCQFLPMLLLGSWAGAVADRHSKRKMALLTQSLQAAQAIALGGFVLAGVVNLPLLYGLSFVLGLVNAFDNPARRGFVTELVEPDDIGNALSLNTAVMTGSRVVGPALAAVLKEPLGAGWLFMLNGLSFAAIVGSLLLIDRSQLRPAPRAARGGTPVRDALRFIGSDRHLRTIFIVFTVVGTFAFNYSVSLLKLSDIRFDSTVGFGLLLAATGLGSVIGSLLTGARPIVTPAWFLGSGVLLGVSGIALAWSPNLTAALVLSVPVGMGGAAFIAAQNVIVQQESPDDMRGRLLALGAVAFLGSTPIGAPITGLVADHVSAEWSLAYGSVTTLGAVAVGALVLRPALGRANESAARPSVPTSADAH
ncbi:MAG TPA: MFS transporter [Acidimicrobiaceae bacterium]|nr:MFS transporter [Acidimicrobiaceae bacterium]